MTKQRTKDPPVREDISPIHSLPLLHTLEEPASKRRRGG
jgi:hypothetical protein